MKGLRVIRFTVLTALLLPPSLSFSHGTGEAQSASVSNGFINISARVSCGDYFDDDYSWISVSVFVKVVVPIS